MKKSSRVIIIPGGQIVPMDEIGPELMIRCKAALSLFDTGDFDYILATGGLTNPRDVQTIPEARIIKRWLRLKSVPREKIILEDKSLDSFQDIEFGLRSLKKANIVPAELVVVTQWQHAIRYWISLRLGYGVKAKITLKMLFPKLSLKSYFMEFLFIAYHLVDPRGRGSLVAKRRRWIRKRRSQ